MEAGNRNDVASALVAMGVRGTAAFAQMTSHSTGPRKSVRPGGNDIPFVYSGTLVVQGRGIAEVHATGQHTEIGNVGRALQSVRLEKTDLQQETARWVRILAIIGILLCVLVVLLYGFTRGSWLNGILSGLTLAMAILPNELPVVLTIFMALGAWRISKRNVLTRRVPVVEVLGSASVLALILTNRSWGKTILGGLRSPNSALWWVLGGTWCFLGLVICVPLSRALFRFSVLHLHDIAICLRAAILSVIWFEVFKLWRA